MVQRTLGESKDVAIPADRHAAVHAAFHEVLNMAIVEGDLKDWNDGIIVAVTIYKVVIRAPDKGIRRTVPSQGNTACLARAGAVGQSLDSHDLPAIRFEARFFLGAIGQQLAVWRELRAAVGG